jgi:A/G-specific adenine glycosylase
MRAPFAALPLAQHVIDWQTRLGRHDLPWQNTRDPYRVWLSEIMLQQTQVSAVLGYYQRFLQTFPTVQDLARAQSDTVMAQWAGLGYYSRARNLHACARLVVSEHGGEFPRQASQLEQLPGIGRSTAAAIAAFCFGEPAPILDGNVKRVFARVYAIEGWPGEGRVEKQMWQLAQTNMDALVEHTPGEALPHALAAYTQGLMDLGATLCTRRKPVCEACPVAGVCQALAQSRVHQLPSPKPAKAVPTRHVVLWLPVQEDAVWLSLRPERGIWGGLWSPLEQALDPADWPLPAARLEALAQASGFTVQRALQPVAHAFSHYKLWMLPVVVDTRADEVHEPREPSATRHQARWFMASELGDVGLAAPIKLVLNDLFSSR